MYSMVDCYADMGQIGQECSVREYNMDDLELDQVTQVIGYHPRFLDHFLRTQNFIMNGDGPLPYDYRYYLAIIKIPKNIVKTIVAAADILRYNIDCELNNYV
ncbi:Sestrin like protein [Lucilia cuprina]|nr:Sestrin like protein [Lucilia cuprina]